MKKSLEFGGGGPFLPPGIFDFGHYEGPALAGGGRPDCFDFNFGGPGAQGGGMMPPWLPCPPTPPPLPIHINKYTEHLVPTALNVALDPGATDEHGHMLVGSGIPSTSFNVQHNTLADIEGAININYRQGDVISAYSVDNHGVLDFYVPTGSQVADPAHGVPSANANRAAWNVNFSVDALGGHTLDEYDVHLKFDLDPSAAVNYLDLHLVPLPTGVNSSESGYMWVNFATGQPAIADGGGILDHVDQNSFNFAFIKSQIDSNPNLAGIQPYSFGEGVFDIELTATMSYDHAVPAHGPKDPSVIFHIEDTVIDLHAQVHVVPPTDFHLV